MRSTTLLCAVLAVIAAACGEPEVDVTLPGRAAGQHVADLAGVLDAAELETRLSALRDDGMDIVVLTYETEQAGCGEAYRAARRFVADWEADVALVAVAEPGDFTSDAPDRERCLGVQPREERGVSGAVRERIAEELVPPLAEDNEWDAAFDVAAEALVRP